MRMRATPISRFVVLLLTLFAVRTLNAQQDSTEKTKARDGRGAVASDANIKTTADTNVKGAIIAAPPEKGGVQTRGTNWCGVRVNNKTSFYIKIYIDGRYRGEMPAFGDLGVWIECGRTRFYARAEFNDGSYKYWGPWDYLMITNYTWEISP